MNMQATNMNLDNTSHAGRPRPDELVPSRYALKVGDIDVLVISDGVLSLPTRCWRHTPTRPTGRPVNDSVAAAGNVRLAAERGRGAERRQDHPHRRRVGADSNLPKAGQLGHRLEAAGIDLAILTDVVLTHMHMDHIGGLLVDGVKEQLRPDLRIHVAAAEVKFWASPDFSPSPCRRVSRRRFNRPPSGS